MEGVVLLNASTGRLEGWGSLDVGGPVELVIWRSVSSLETAPMWVSPTQYVSEQFWILEHHSGFIFHRKAKNFYSEKHSFEA
jgi:hypothetical protein